MKFKSSRVGRVLRWIVILIVVVLVGLYIIMPVSFGVAAVLQHQSPVGAPPAGFEEITLTTGDGVNLQAWYSAPANGAAIVLVHGSGDSRENVRDYADLLARHSYGVLALDLRGHGESEGATNRLGWQGTLDVGAAVAFLQTQQDVDVIGGLGLSMGAETLLGAASEYPALEAIVAEGATHRCLAELLALESEQPLYRNFTPRVMFATVQLLSGEKPPSPLLDSMAAARNTSFYLIAGGGMDAEVAYNTLFANTVSDQAMLWIAPDSPHISALKLYPEEYEQRAIAFFDAKLLANAGGAS